MRASQRRDSDACRSETACGSHGSLVSDAADCCCCCCTGGSSAGAGCAAAGTTGDGVADATAAATAAATAGATNEGELGVAAALDAALRQLVGTRFDADDAGAAAAATAGDGTAAADS
jgi:hypothetical protein